METWNRVTDSLLEHNNIKIPLEKRFFLSLLDDTDNDVISKKKVVNEIIKLGFYNNDPRVHDLFHNISNIHDEECLTYEQFKECIGNHICIISKVLRRELIIPNFPEFCLKIKELYEETKDHKDGSVASYIPQLARVNPEQFGVSICTVDGQRYNIGDTYVDFSIQSCCKPINYGIALEENGEDYVHTYVGREPSGQSFNELTLNKKGLPHNPLINSGAIMTTSLIKKDVSQSERFEHIIQVWSDLCGGIYKIGFNNPVYLSEKKTADRNFALAYFMKETNEEKKVGFPENTNLNETLELYFQSCSMEVTSEVLSMVAATLANGGINPFTGKKVFSPDTVKNMLSMMLMCGMYDYSGEYAFKIGIPSKSGVGGAIMIIIPNVMGIVTWSPRLDMIGNSSQGIEFCKRFGKSFNFHIFGNIADENKLNPTESSYTSVRNNEFSELCLSAKQGDIEYLKILFNKGVNMSQSDYDGRTALHLSVCENHFDIVYFLLTIAKVKKDPKDRWGNTPKREAETLGYDNILELFN